MRKALKYSNSNARYFLPSILSNAWIGDDWSKNSNMWIHPGSGGEYKNMPFLTEF